MESKTDNHKRPFQEYNYWESVINIELLSRLNKLPAIRVAYSVNLKE